MLDKRITLESASFLDSEHARGVADVPAGGIKKIVEAFLTCAYDEQGTAPNKCDGHDIHSILGHLMPAHFKKKDPLAKHVPAVSVRAITRGTHNHPQAWGYHHEHS